MNLIVLNHKMNLSFEEVLEYREKINKLKPENIEVVVCPSSIYLPIFREAKVKLGSQNVSNYENGAHTGDVSASQLKSINTSYCLIGHSERRKEFKEENDQVNEKIAHLLKYKIKPILCIGETLEEKQAKKTKEVITEQIVKGIDKVPLEALEDIIIAYEPVWAIGTGIIPTITQIDEIAFYIKNYIKHHYSKNLKVIYGGSVNEENIDELKELKEIDGFLLGGVSLKLEKIKDIIKKLKGWNNSLFIMQEGNRKGIKNF